MGDADSTGLGALYDAVSDCLWTSFLARLGLVHVDPWLLRFAWLPSSLCERGSVGMATPGRGPTDDTLVGPAGTFGATDVDAKGIGTTGTGAIGVGATDMDTGKVPLVEPKAGTCGGGVAEGWVLLGNPGSGETLRG